MCRASTRTQDHGLEKSLDNSADRRSRAAIDKGREGQFIGVARNVNRSVGAMLSGSGPQCTPKAADDTIRIQLENGRQSFRPSWQRHHLLYLIGDANDYTGKALGRPRGGASEHRLPWRATGNIIIGNTVLYGATTGRRFFSGVAASALRCACPAPRPSVEGTGDHGCEYMTGGTVVVLGKTGPQLRRLA